ncbi:hypothetical protein BCV69DRAFT_245823 [Microstroma glucosiphilum]|uniref:P-loop containing nucleoside triphosphate hydrolase protein n=1 Tax=Pseudomicrostroma glucosiphilum TaxID=1684307 RepID=A0A316UDW2_9BASI|nr:hypothetical protein BCV69DRAFT_245823 [Pseudomicrostroma glucosiphilum]PWN23044.1 hypothetical protein BCV69DRAFT_245823 [Pseudomicrostroma glucosiphilum]
MSTRKISVLSSFIRDRLHRHRALHGSSASSSSVPPLIIGMQGPQGSGKTTITSQLMKACSTSTDPLRLACISLDDLYLPYAGLTAVARANPTNKLLSGRGQPGTHDLPLGHKILGELKAINDGGGHRIVELPIFDKSLHDGKGDRSSETVRVSTPPRLDVLLFEGWCLGFEAFKEEAQLKKMYEETQRRTGAGTSEQKPYFLSHPLEDLLAINVHLRELSQALYPYLDAFVKLVPSSSSPPPSSSSPSSSASPRDLSQVFTWRTQAERAMKASNGGKGMTDEQVVQFVARYMPGYELWDQESGGGMEEARHEWRFHEKGASVQLGLGKDRELLWLDLGEGRVEERPES